MYLIARKSLIMFLEENDLVINTLYGFLPRRIWLKHSLQRFDFVRNQQFHPSAVEVMYLYFSKVFVMVDHGILYHKFRSLCIIWVTV